MHSNNFFQADLLVLSNCHKLSFFNNENLKLGHIYILDMLFPFLAFIAHNVMKNRSRDGLAAKGLKQSFLGGSQHVALCCVFNFVQNYRSYSLMLAVYLSKRSGAILCSQVTFLLVILFQVARFEYSLCKRVYIKYLLFNSAQGPRLHRLKKA